MKVIIEHKIKVVEFDDVPASTILQDADEQIETPKPISAVFDSPGIKKLTF